MVDVQVERAQAPARRRFDVDDYYQLAEAGILRPDERVELVDGDVIAVSPQGSPHAAVVSRLTRILLPVFGARALLRAQLPLRLGRHSEPEPDVALVSFRADDYVSGHPTAEDALLVIEIGVTSLAFDRAVKAPLYARHGVPELWLVDLAGRTVHVLREPGPDGFAREETLGPDQQLAVPGFPDLVLHVRDVVP